MAFSQGLPHRDDVCQIIEAGLLRWQSIATHILRVSRGPLSGAIADLLTVFSNARFSETGVTIFGFVSTHPGSRPR